MKCGGASLRKSDLLDSPPVLPHRKPESRRKSTPLLEQPPILRQTKAATFRRRAQSINTKSPFTSATLPAGDSKASRMKMKQHLALVNKGGEAIEIEDMIAMAGDLDVIMVATNDRTMSSLIRLATWSEYDHVLFIRRSRHTGRLSVVEAVESGVVSYGITEFIRDWSEGRYFRVAYRKLLGGLHDSSRKALEDFCSSHIGSPFGISGFFFANDFTVTPPSSPDALSSKPAQSSFSRDRTRKPLGSEESNSRRKKLTRRRRKDHSTGRRPWDSRRAFFCSELVAAAYRSAGVLKRECSEGSFTPGKFASKSCPWLAESFQLGPVMQIVLKKMKPIGFWPGKTYEYSSRSEPPQSSNFRSKTLPLSSDRANITSSSSSPPLIHVPVLGTPPTPSTPRSKKTGAAKQAPNGERDVKERTKSAASRDSRPPLLVSPVPEATKLTSPTTTASAEQDPHTRGPKDKKHWWREEAKRKKVPVMVANGELKIMSKLNDHKLRQ